MSGPQSRRRRSPAARGSPAGARTCPSASSRTPTSSGSWTRPTSGSRRVPGSASDASLRPTRRPRRSAAIAAKRAVAVAGLEPDDIDLIIVATLTPDYPMPATAVLRQGGHRQPDRGRIRPRGGVLRVRLRVRHRRCLHPFGPRSPRPAHRRGAADALPRLQRPGHVHPLRGRRRRGRPLRVGRGGWRPRRPGAHDRPRRRLHDLAALGRLEEPAHPRDDASRRAFHPHGGPRDVPLRDTNAGGVGPGGDREGRLGAGRRRPVHPPSGEHPYHRGGRQGARAPDGEDVRQRRSLRQHVGRLGRHRARRGGPERSHRAGRPPRPRGLRGRLHERRRGRSPGRPTRPHSARSRGRRPARPASARPSRWAGVDPIPPRLAAVLADPTGPPVPLDDVVPGEPGPRARRTAR